MNFTLLLVGIYFVFVTVESFIEFIERCIGAHDSDWLEDSVEITFNERKYTVQGLLVGLVNLARILGSAGIAYELITLAFTLP